ncbi:hypothetical protein J4760_00135 [Salinicoccus sp. ID82-1]|uniref:Glycosyltransferase RgtA/B/C/D-like domain-containing protein n=1 Tax=Salinicoccus cyprini TaxID=2493691 RepID=A0A558AXF5_9STAP|nr:MULTISPECIES: hypothetical protein [Salinicoccus]MCG1008450.1 hypothetical protein [Salinicoccus sp. ID82-1]TVT28939.1 hypothetical protein FO441_01285 [Salinicoccus cyprini]
MLIIWLIALVYVVMGYLFRFYIADTNLLTVSFIVITALMLFFILYLKYTKFLMIIYAGFLVRLGTVLYDLQPKVPKLPHSGIDSENYYKTAQYISEKMDLMNAEMYGGIYTKFLAVIFNMYGDDRLFAQFLNVLMTLSAILLVIHIFRMLDVPPKVQIILVGVMSFFPHSILFSSILVREAVITLMMALSLYFFVRWYKKREWSSAIFSVIIVLIGASFHTAVIGVIVGYMFGFIFYQHKQNAFRFTLKSTIPFSLFALATTYVLVFPESIEALPIYDKIDQVQRGNDSLFDAFTDDIGGSAYLSSLVVSNIYQAIAFSPIKMLYFIGSPMPWTIRNMNDVIAFLLDGTFYLLALAVFIKNFGLIKRRPILGVILLSIVVTWIIFGIGISNAGTALRHRFKIFYIIIVALGVIWSKKEKEKKSPGLPIKGKQV